MKGRSLSFLRMLQGHQLPCYSEQLFLTRRTLFVSKSMRLRLHAGSQSSTAVLAAGDVLHCATRRRFLNALPRSVSGPFAIRAPVGHWASSPGAGNARNAWGGDMACGGSGLCGIRIFQDLRNSADPPLFRAIPFQPAQKSTKPSTIFHQNDPFPNGATHPLREPFRRGAAR